MKRLLTVLALLLSMAAHAQKLDTVLCNYKYVEVASTKTQTGKIKYYIIYRDPAVNDIISTTKTVVEYIQLCESKNLVPNLGIKLKDGRIVGVVKMAKKYRKQ